jgi:hypothetical protein
MLRTNLATRPFYNDRAVRVGIGLATLAVAALSTFNVLQVLSLNARNSEMSARAGQAEAQAAQHREQARVITQAMDKVEVTAVHDAASEANLLIQRRAFSWTELFNRFEHTLPSEVRISAVEPQIDREGRLLIQISTVSRRVEDLHIFIDQLESAGGLRDVIPRHEEAQDDGTYRAVLQGYYDDQKAASAAAASAPLTSEQGSGSGNASPTQPGAGVRSPEGTDR